MEGRMICLDTNYLIRGIALETKEANHMAEWAQQGEILIVSSIAWYEFLCGPVSQSQIYVMKSFLTDVVPFDEIQAQEAARLFNMVKRNRRLRIDALIAALAITRNCPLATNNKTDFDEFTPHGLKLI
jgi:predicted nucleic acid-binding protein